MYNIKTVVKLTGIPAVTIRAWENRYGVVEPARTDGGHRLYTDRDVDDLRWLKRQIDEKGMNISQAAKLLVHRREPEPPVRLEPIGKEDGFDKLAGPLYDALIRYRAEEANRLIDLGFALYAYEDLFHRVLVPILHRIGDDWESGRISVAQEHFASGLLHQRFHSFFRLLPVRSDLPRAIAFCPPGEHHQLGLLLFVLFLRRKGLDVLYLGADTPPDGVVQAIADHGAAIVCSSLTGKRHLKPAIAMLKHIAERYPAVRFVLGGRAFAEEGHPFKGDVLSGGRESWERWFDGIREGVPG